MPFWHFASLILTVGLAAATWGGAAAGAAIAAAVLLAVSVVMSIALLVPLNNGSKTGDVSRFHSSVAAGAMPRDGR